jgi:1-deoxy-D-xylulose-5-phosphate synthase
MVVPGTIFEEFGFNYVGPIDGHDLDALIPTLENLRDKRGSAVPACGHQEGLRLQAGRGRPDAYHGPGKFDPAWA